MVNQIQLQPKMINNSPNPKKFNNSTNSEKYSFTWSQTETHVNIEVTANVDVNAQLLTAYSSCDQFIVVYDGVEKLKLKLDDDIMDQDTKIICSSDRFNFILAKRDSSKEWTSIERIKSDVEMGGSDEEMDGSDEEMEASGSPGVKLVENPKQNFIERNDSPLVLVYLYVTNIDRESFEANFYPSGFTLRFTTSDQNFLKNYADSDEHSVFEWTLKTKGEIEPSKCSFKISQAKVELKLKKVLADTWASLTETKSVKPEVPKDTWVGCTRNQSKNLNIPLAPPAPPTFNQMKKPSTLPSPSKSSVNSSRTNNGGYSYSADGSPGSPSLRGMVGLENIGNTCFMNSVLQCLANCRELREYFMEYNFQQDLNKDNPLGMGGKLAISFAILMKCLWSSNERSFAPSKLKSIMSLKANQFCGFAQHDAQEFMVELLDGLHEDLNRIKKKPYMAEAPDLDGWTDKEAAEEAWRLHKTRNDSVVDDLFKGQFKSTLKCHDCGKVSVKFDEFCCLSVPIPKDQKVIQVVFFWRAKTKQPRKFFVKVAADAMIDELKRKLSVLTNVHPMAIQVMDSLMSKIQKIFSKCTSLSSISQSDMLLAFEILTEDDAGEPVVELAVTQRMVIPSPPKICSACSRVPASGSKLYRCTRCNRVGYCNSSCQESHWPSHKVFCRQTPEPVGTPFIMSMPESAATYANLVATAENYARYSVDIFQPPVNQKKPARRPRKGSTSSGDGSSAEEMEVDSDGSVHEVREVEMEGGCYSGEDRAEEDWPLSPSNAMAVSVAFKGDRNGRSSSASSSGSGEEIPRLSASPTAGKRAAAQHSVNLATRLFTLKPCYTKSVNLATHSVEPFHDKGDEPIDLTDIHVLMMDWCNDEKSPVHCFVQNKSVDCEVQQEDAVPRSKHTTLDACVDLFTQPENLSEGDSWCCPRCKKPVEATKQMCLWRLPHILIIQLKRFSFKYVLYSDKIDKFVQYPIRGLDLAPYVSENSPESAAVYDLFGVINHMGRILGGHYTAYCRTVDPHDSTKSEIDWRICDDSRVNLVSESRVVHEQAYLLLYRRRGESFAIAPPLSAAAADEDASSEGDSSDQCPGATRPEPVAARNLNLAQGDPPGSSREHID